jgi:hypothetical protein
MAAMPEKPLIFVSCGQETDDERSLGVEIARLIRDTTKFEAYFAEQQNTLEDLVGNILSALNRCVGFVAVMHHRGFVERSDRRFLRGSVWVEQEVAIAAFIRNVLNRSIQVALYIQKGIEREGVRDQLLLRPIEFSSNSEIIADIKERIQSWTAEPVSNLTLTQDEVLPENRPKVVPVRYARLPDHRAIGEALYMANDGTVAYDVRVDPITIGEWTLECDPVARLDGEAFSKVTISRNEGRDLCATLDPVWRSSWEAMGHPAGVTVYIYYADFDGRYYRSVCTLERDVNQSSGFSVRRERQERIEKLANTALQPPSGAQPGISTERDSRAARG